MEKKSAGYGIVLKTLNNVPNTDNPANIYVISLLKRAMEIEDSNIIGSDALFPILKEAYKSIGVDSKSDINLQQSLSLQFFMLAIIKGHIIAEQAVQNALRDFKNEKHKKFIWHFSSK